MPTSGLLTAVVRIIKRSHAKFSKVDHNHHLEDDSVAVLSANNSFMYCLKTLKSVKTRNLEKVDDVDKVEGNIIICKMVLCEVGKTVRYRKLLA